MLCCRENMAEEIKISVATALTFFSVIAFSARNTLIAFAIRRMYQTNSFRHASPHIRRMS